MTMYAQDRVYALLKKRGPMTARDIAAELGIPCATNVLYRMSCKGITRPLTKPSPSCKHEIVAGAGEPEDMRGRQPGSLEALRKHSRHNIAKTNAKLGRHKKPVATTALEQCWGWLPSPSQLRAESKSVLISGGTVRPEET